MNKESNTEWRMGMADGILHSLFSVQYSVFIPDCYARGSRCD
jgi:hypothetical protein